MHLSPNGLPLGQRGMIGIDTAGFLSSKGHDAGASTELVASIPVGRRAFADASVPFGLGIPFGNPSLGGHYVFRMGDHLWMGAGSTIGVPLLAPRDEEAIVGAVPRAAWNLHDYLTDIVPIAGRFGLEAQVSFFHVRLQADPILYVPIGENDEVHGAFQHALELQVGDTFGAGLRVQGVIIGPGNDNYQGAIEPFVIIEHPIAFLRTGVMIPLDKELGPPFKESWGFLLATGIRLD